MEKEKFEKMNCQKTQVFVSNLMTAYWSMLNGTIPVSQKTIEAVREVIKELSAVLADWSDAAYFWFLEEEAPRSESPDPV